MNSKIRDNGSLVAVKIRWLYPIEGWVNIQPSNAWNPTFHPSPNKCLVLSERKNDMYKKTSQKTSHHQSPWTRHHGSGSSWSIYKFQKIKSLSPVLTDIALDTSTNVHLCLSPQTPSYRYPHRVLILIIVLFLVWLSGGSRLSHGVALNRPKIHHKTMPLELVCTVDGPVYTIILDLRLKQA